VTPKAYAMAARHRRVREALAGAGTVTEAIYDAGYGSSSRFYECSTALLGMTPRRYRKGGVSEVIRFAIGDCSLGAIIVAATERGVCCVEFGDDPRALLQSLERRFANATLVGADAAFEDLAARVVALLEQPRAAHDLPLDLRGTAFQLRVWQALSAIPCGRTATYTDIARAIGNTAAVRAVAGACAANPVAVAIPCHRVVRSDGSLSGYRWGIARKRQLIEREADG
jgi:AraC family transcriptional regulator, regulatory protein of adaptative response / methylated-DNA-[protein]-cysteine methyltransferase